MDVYMYIHMCVYIEREFLETSAAEDVPGMGRTHAYI